MNYVVIVILIAILVILWSSKIQYSKKTDKIIEEIEAQNRTNLLKNLTNKDLLALIYRSIIKIDDLTTQIVSIATKENPAGVNFHEYIRSDNLASIYADYLERYQDLPQNLAMKRARFEIAKFGQDTIIKKINLDFRNGVQYRRKQDCFLEFFSSGILEKDIESRLEEKIIPFDLFAPLYDLIVKQGYSGERDFAAELTPYTVKTYEEMVTNAAIISRLEKLGIFLRTAGKDWGDFLRYRLKSTDKNELKRLIYSEGSSHDDDFFDERYNEGDLPRIFDAHNFGLIK